MYVHFESDIQTNPAIRKATFHLYGIVLSLPACLIALCALNLMVGT